MFFGENYVLVFISKYLPIGTVLEKRVRRLKSTVYIETMPTKLNTKVESFFQRKYTV